MAGKTDKWFGTLTAANFNDYAKLDRVITQPNGVVDTIIRYVPDLSATAAEATKDNLDAVTTVDSPKVDGISYDGNTWQNAFVYVEQQPDGGRTVRQWLKLPVLRSPSADGAPDVCSNFVAEVQSGVGRYEATQTQAYLGISDTDAGNIMGTTDTTYTPAGLAFFRSRREKNEDGTNNVYVTGKTITINIGGWSSGDTFTLEEEIVVRVPDESATMGYKWQQITKTIDCEYNSSDSTARDHISGGEEGSQVIATGDGNFLAMKVTYESLGSWTYTDWPSS